MRVGYAVSAVGSRARKPIFRRFAVPLNKKLRAEWKKAGYSSEMGSAEVVPPPSEDFIRLYHITTTEFAISNIGLSRIKVARFSDLNDPFELTAVSFRNKFVRKIVLDFKNACDRHIGLLCFSADWTNPVLWGHYGVKHRGICLGFNLKRARTHKVKYEAERIPAELETQGNPPKLDDNLKKLLLCTKFRHWEYEEEYRVFVPLDKANKEGTLHFYPFGQYLELAEVILGPRCSVSLKSVRQLTQAQHPHAVTFKARPAYKFFKVVPNGWTVP